MVMACSGIAKADLALTAAAETAGFGLVTQSSGYTDGNGNGTGVGPLSVGFTASGGTVVSYYTDNALVFYPTDGNNQTVAGNGTIVTGYPTSTGIVSTGSHIYVADQGAGSIIKLNADGSFNSTLTTGLGPATGMALNPSNGHIYVSNLSGTIFNVDPATGVAKPFVSGITATYAPDGLSISADGSTLFAEVNEHILGYSTATGQQVFDSGAINLADGAAAAAGALTGNLFVNTNDGKVYEVNEKTLAETLIASGGSRGDLVTVDPTDGSLLLSQSNSIDRLTLPADSSFPTSGFSASPVPEPATMGVLSIGMLGLGMFRRQKG